MSFKFEIARNFRNYPFSSIIDDGCYNKMKNEIFSVLKQCIPNYSLIEKKYIETSIASLLFPSDYSSSNHKDQDYYVISPDHGR